MPNTSYFSPQWLGGAYGDNNIYFGSAVGNGAGQTIAIVDAYNDPNIAADLATYDATFGLAAPPSFSVVNQTGGSTLPADRPNECAGPNNVDWEFEESIDVEWAQCIAPGANIVLVEANTDQNTDLYSAVKEAAKLGTVVSMSWGGSEASNEHSKYDGDFTTTGVTFLAATGDGGSPGEYPAYSPDVVAVGGTNLTANSNTYAWEYETAWSDSGGGTSQYESEPSFQDAVQSTGKRTIPDVSADAGVGVWICDSFDNTNGEGDWYGAGGTSVACPIWAGLIAIADQGRVTSGQSVLTGSTQTLPALYQLEENDSADFHDITSGSNGGFRGSRLRRSDRSGQPGR